MADQFLLDLVGRRLLLVYLVERDNDRHVGCFGMIDRLNGLRHHAVVGRNHQHNDIGRFGSTSPHCRECLVAGRIQKGDDATGGFHVIRANVLSNSTRLARRTLGAPDVSQQ